MIVVTVPGPPPRKNERHKVIRLGNRGSLRNSDAYETFCVRLMRAWMDSGQPKIEDGVWHMSVVSYWARLAKKKKGVPIPGGPFPAGDFDAPLSSIADALQVVGAIDDDLRIESGDTKKSYDKHDPRVVITMRRLR